MEMTVSSRHIQSLISDNERLQKEQDRLSDVQTKLINESRKREQELRRQVSGECLFFVPVDRRQSRSSSSIKRNWRRWRMTRTN